MDISQIIQNVMSTPAMTPQAVQYGPTGNTFTDVLEAFIDLAQASAQQAGHAHLAVGHRADMMDNLMNGNYAGAFQDLIDWNNSAIAQNQANTNLQGGAMQFANVSQSFLNTTPPAMQQWAANNNVTGQTMANNATAAATWVMDLVT